MEKVLREMIRETVNSAINSMINNYMRERTLMIKGNPSQEDEVLSNTLDPINRVARQILDDLIRDQYRTVLREEVLNEQKQGSLMSDYMLEASFIPYFNNRILAPFVRQIAVEAIFEVSAGEIVEELVEAQVKASTKDVIE